MQEIHPAAVTVLVIAAIQPIMAVREAALRAAVLREAAVVQTRDTRQMSVEVLLFPTHVSL